jgi:putative membrane protein
MMHWGYAGSLGLGVGLLGLLFWIFLLTALIWLVFRAFGPRYHAPDDEAMTILRTRFARGEITPEEFEKAATALGAKR